VAEVASLVASIIIDKNDVSVQALKAISSAQRDLENNKLEIFFDLSDASLAKELNKVQKKLSTTDYKIKVVADGKEQFAKDLKEFQKIIKDFASGKGINTGIGKSLIDEKQLKSTIELFSNIEKHLSDIKKVISDVGDGNELSPLLTTIKQVSDSISQLSTKTQNLGFNMNIDVGTDGDLDRKLQAKIASALQSYQNLFNHIKMSGAAGSLTDKFFDFDINQYDNSMQKLQAYIDFIKNARKEAKSLYGGHDIIREGTDKSYWTQASSALAQITKVQNEIKKSTNGGTEAVNDIFGKTDLSEVIGQLSTIVSKLGEISTAVSTLPDIFKNGLNVNTSVEEIINLTNKVKELETELANVRNNDLTSPQKTNISSASNQKKDAFPDSSTDIKSETNGIENVEKATNDAAQAKKDFATANKGVQSSIDSSENPLKLEAELMNQIAKSAREAADAKKEFVEANKQVKESSNDSNSNLGGSSEDFKNPKKAKKNKYSKYKKISEDEFFTNSNDYITAANKKLTENDNIILGNSVDAKLITDGLAEGLVQVTAKIKDANGAWKTFSAKIDADGNIFDEILKPIIENINLLEEKLANFDHETSPALTYQQTLDAAQRIKNSLNLGDEYTISVDSNEFVTINKKISDINGETKTLTQTFKSAQDAIDNFGKATSNSAEKTKVALKKVEKQKKEVVETDTVATDSDKSDDINYLTKLTKLLNNIKKLRKDNEVLQKDPVKNAPVIKANNENIEALRKQYASTLANAKASGNFDTEAFAREKAEIDSNTEAVLKNAAARRQVAQAQTQAKADQKDVTDTDFIIKQTESLMSKFNAYKATNTKLFASSKPEAQKLVTQFDEMYNRLIMIKEQADRVKNGFADSFDGKSIREARKDIQDLSGEFRNFSNDVKTAGYNSKTLGDTLKTTFKNLAQYFVGANALQNIQRGFTEVYNAAKEYNESVVNLQIASGENEDYVNSLMKTYNGMAKTLGATTKEVAESADSWLRQGYSLEDTNNLITASMVQSKVGQLDSAESTQYLTSALKGYKLEASDAMNVVDKMSAVDLQVAVSLGGLAEAMAETANSARTMGISMDQLLGYAAVVGETTQDSMSSVGNAFKRIFSRMGNVKAGKFISDDGEDLSDVEKVLKKFNIKLRDSKDEFRNFGDVIDEVASRWNTFTSVEQRAIVTAMAGAAQSEKLLVLFENYPNALKYAETAANASGTAMEKFGAYEEGVEAKTKEVKAAFEGLSNSLLDSDAIKVVLEGLTKLIEALDFLVEKVGTLGSIGTIISGVAGAKGYGLTYSYKSWLQTPYYA